MKLSLHLVAVLLCLFFTSQLVEAFANDDKGLSPAIKAYGSASSLRKEHKESCSMHRFVFMNSEVILLVSYVASLITLTF
jgi:hypothetical protein